MHIFLISLKMKFNYKQNRLFQYKYYSLNLNCFQNLTTDKLQLSLNYKNIYPDKIYTVLPVSVTSLFCNIFFFVTKFSASVNHGMLNLYTKLYTGIPYGGMGFLHLYDILFLFAEKCLEFPYSLYNGNIQNFSWLLLITRW